MTWAVFAPVEWQRSRRAVRHSVGGSAAAPRSGVGVGANALVGGSARPSRCSRCQSRADGRQHRRRRRRADAKAGALASEG